MVDREDILMAGLAMLFILGVCALMVTFVWGTLILCEWISSLHWKAPYSDSTMGLLAFIALTAIACLLVVWGSVDEKETEK